MSRGGYRGPIHSGVTDDQLIDAIEMYGPAEAARRLGLSQRGIYARRKSIERRRGIIVSTRNRHHQTEKRLELIYAQHTGRIDRTVQNGVVLICGDNHYEPEIVTVMHRAFVRLCKELKPVGVIVNGDVCDFASLGRYPRIGWERRHKPRDEIETAQERLGEIEKAAFKAWKAWPLGNHDSRFNTRIANLPGGEEYEGIAGTSLKDHFPIWEPCWAVVLNEGTPAHTIIQHRARGGEHGSYRNAKELHCHYVTGHDHHPYVRGYTSAKYTVYGVNHGMLGDKEQPVFVNYTEGRPLNWRSACAVLTFIDGVLMPPELCEKVDNSHVWFRGNLLRA